MANLLTALSLAMLCIFSSLAFAFDGDMLMEGRLDYASGPVLLYPVTDNVILTGKDCLEFRWQRGYFLEVRYYDFRLYKGDETVSANLILKKKFSLNELPIRLPVAMFEAGQVYTWVLVLVFDSGEKSEPSFSQFRIIKK